MIPFPQNVALILIDIQKGFEDPMWGRRNNPDAETNIASLLHVWRQTDGLFFMFSIFLKTPNHSCEPVIQKRVNSAFIGTDLEERLRREGITTLIITGLTTNHCVETTTRMAGNLGFLTFFVSDATATFDRKGPDGVLHLAEEIQTMTLTNLHQEFATIVTTDDVLRNLV